MLAAVLVLSNFLIAQAREDVRSGSKTVPPEVSTWLREHAVAIPARLSAQPQSAAAFGELIGKARVLCLGDAAAGGAREIVELERDLLAHAVAALDVRVLAIDANATETAALDDHLATGEGDPAALVAALRAPRWQTREFLDAIAWLRKWNADPAHAAKVRLVGLDVQYTQLAAQQIGDYIQKVDYEAALRITSILSPLRQADRDGRPRYANTSPELRYVTMVYLSELAGMLDENREAHVQVSSEVEWQRAKQAVVFLIQAEEVLRAAIEDSASEHPGRSVHERVLADNVAHALELAGGDGRVVVWTDLERVLGGMGALVRERVGADALTIGLTFSRGEGVVRRAELTCPSGTNLESALAGTVPPRAWIDLRRSPADGVLADWLGALRSKLDVVLFVETVSPPAR